MCHRDRLWLPAQSAARHGKRGCCGVVILTTIRTVEQTGSTNADMLALAAAGAEDGLWLRAIRQTQGRGRLDRAWESPEGNLHCSTLVRLRPDDPAAPGLALVAAVAAWRAVDSVLPGKASIKWPNDLMIGAAKLCGMLLERVGDAVVIGIGINVRAHPSLPDRPTTSLWAQGAVDADAASLLTILAQHMADLLTLWRTAGLAAIRPLWLAAAHPSGTPLRAALPDGTALEGHFAGLDASGALLLDLGGGRTHSVHAGDLFLI